jgi:hypothetical protein
MLGLKPMECENKQKFQITNHKFQANHNDQNSKFQACFCHLILEFGILLEFGAWDLRFYKALVLYYTPFKPPLGLIFFLPADNRFAGTNPPHLARLVQPTEV